MAVFAATGGSLGFDPSRAFDLSDGVFDFREGSPQVGVDGYTYVFVVASADIAAGTAGAPPGGVTAGQGYWRRGNSMGTGSVADYEAEYPTLDQPYDVAPEEEGEGGA